MLYFFTFLMGLFGGVLLTSLYFSRKTKPVEIRPDEDDLEARVEALEEAMGYAMERLETAAAEVAAEGRPVEQRPRKRRTGQTPEKDWQRVISLAEEGHDPQSIAREVGKPQGQVELITKLYGKG